MRNRVPDEATCAICGRHFDPSETRGWCPNPSCGEWQHPSFPIDDTGADDGQPEESTSSTSPSTDTKDCPNCGNEVRADANFCKHCATQLSGTSAEQTASENEDDTTIECPDCGADLSQIPSDRLARCPICMFDLGPMGEDTADAATGGDTGAESETGTGADTGRGTGADTGRGTGADTGRGTGADTGARSGTGADTGSGTGASADTGRGTGADTGSGTGASADTGRETGASADTGGGTGADTGRETGASADTGGETGAGRGAGAGTSGAGTDAERGSATLTECPNCGEDLTPMPPKMRTVCPGCRVDLSESVEADSGPAGRPRSGTAAGHRSGRAQVSASTPLAELDAIADGYVQRLAEGDITTVGELQRADPDTVSARTGISARRIRGWLDDIPVDTGETGGEHEHAESGGTDDGVDLQSTRIQRSPDDLVLDVMGQELTVTDGETVGREVRSAMVQAGAPEEDAVYVHRKHIRIEVDDEGFWLTRLGENNLTVNGRTVEKGATVPLEDGDEIGFSDVVTATVSVR